MRLEVELGLAAAAVFVLTPVLARVARGRGWVDRREGAEALRKPRQTPVPPVGGIAIAGGLGLLAVSTGFALGAVPWAAFLLALAVGAYDDARPLRARVKFSAHLAIALVLALEGAARGRPAGDCVLLAGVALLAVNALNTWDHADGMAGGCAMLGLGLSPPAAACAGFLPWNTVLRRQRGRESVPVAYLGDGGSHSLGVLLAWNPSAWPVLVVPLVDLARVVQLRLACGQSPWHGDRRHLGQRMERAGWTPVGAALAAAACLLPAAFSPTWGLGVALLGYAGLLVATASGKDADPGARDDACEGPAGER